MASIIDTSRVDFSIVAETVAGVTPANPAFQRVPIVSGGPQGTRTTATSEAIRADRQKSDLITTDQDVAGDIVAELSYAAFNPYLHALMIGASPADVTSGASGSESGDDITISASAGTITSSADFDFSGLPVGAYVKVSGASNEGNNGLFRVLSRTQRAITVHTQDRGALVDESPGSDIDIKWRHVTNGILQQDPQTYTMRKRVNATPDVYMYYRGCAFDTMSISVETGSIVQATFGVVGRTETITANPISGENVTDYADVKLLNSVDSLSLTSEGLGTGSIIQSATMEYNNNYLSAKAVSHLGSVDVIPSGLEITGDIVLYFRDITVYDKFTQSDGFPLSFKFQDSDGNAIVILLPYCKFSSVETPLAGRDEFLVINASYEAIADPTLGWTAGMNLIAA